MLVWVYIHVWVCIYVLYVYMLLYTCTSTFMYCIRLSVCLSTCVIMFKYVWICDMCTVACFSDSDPFCEIRTRCWRFRFVLVMDQIHRRFEDRSMGWSVDQYRFVQWIPDSNSVLKLRYFMWVFVLMSFSSLPLLCFIRIISCAFIYILPVWLAVTLHKTLLIVHHNCVIGISLYQYHFMCWKMTVVGLGLVLIYRRWDLIF